MATPAKHEIPWINSDTAQKLIPGAHEFPNVPLSEKGLVDSILSASFLGKGSERFKSVRFIQPSDFFDKPNGLIWRVMQLCVEQGIEISPVSVRNQLVAHKAFEAVGDARLSNISAGIDHQSAAHEVFQASICRLGMYQSRLMLAFSQQGMRVNIAEFNSRMAAITRAVTTKLASYTQRDEMSLFDTAQTGVEQILAQAKDETYEPGFPTGLANFDKVTLGIVKKRLYLFAAPNGWGKTAFVLNIALAMLRQGRNIRFTITADMTREDILNRLICIIAQINTQSLERRDLTDGEIKRIKRAKEEVLDSEAAKHFIVQRVVSPSLEDMEASYTNAMMGDHAPDVVFIDWFGHEKVQFPSYIRDENQASRMAFGKLENWKDTLGPAFIATCQMNKDWDRKKDKRPNLTSIRYGSTATDAAHLVGYIYHERLAKKNSMNDDSEIVIRKNRGGPFGDNLRLMVDWRPQTLTFSASSSEAEAIDGGEE